MVQLNKPVWALRSPIRGRLARRSYNTGTTRDKLIAAAYFEFAVLSVTEKESAFPRVYYKLQRDKV